MQSVLALHLTWKGGARCGGSYCSQDPRTRSTKMFLVGFQEAESEGTVTKWEGGGPVVLTLGRGLEGRPWP